MNDAKAEAAKASAKAASLRSTAWEPMRMREKASQKTSQKAPMPLGDKVNVPMPLGVKCMPTKAATPLGNARVKKPAAERNAAAPAALEPKHSAIVAIVLAAKSARAAATTAAAAAAAQPACRSGRTLDMGAAPVDDAEGDRLLVSEAAAAWIKAPTSALPGMDVPPPPASGLMNVQAASEALPGMDVPPPASEVLPVPRPASTLLAGMDLPPPSASALLPGMEMQPPASELALPDSDVPPELTLSGLGMLPPPAEMSLPGMDLPPATDGTLLTVQEMLSIVMPLPAVDMPLPATDMPLPATDTLPPAVEKAVPCIEKAVPWAPLATEEPCLPPSSEQFITTAELPSTTGMLAAALELPSPKHSDGSLASPKLLEGSPKPVEGAPKLFEGTVEIALSKRSSHAAAVPRRQARKSRLPRGAKDAMEGRGKLSRVPEEAPTAAAEAGGEREVAEIEPKIASEITFEIASEIAPDIAAELEPEIAAEIAAEIAVEITPEDIEAWKMAREAEDRLLEQREDMAGKIEGKALRAPRLSGPFVAARTVQVVAASHNVIACHRFPPGPPPDHHLPVLMASGWPPDCHLIAIRLPSDCHPTACRCFWPVAGDGTRPGLPPLPRSAPRGRLQAPSGRSAPPGDARAGGTACGAACGVRRGGHARAGGCARLFGTPGGDVALGLLLGVASSPGVACLAGRARRGARNLENRFGDCVQCAFRGAFRGARRGVRRHSAPGGVLRGLRPLMWISPGTLPRARAAGVCISDCLSLRPVAPGLPSATASESDRLRLDCPR